MTCRYHDQQQKVVSMSRKFNAARSLGLGLPFCGMFLIYALAFFYGGYLVRAGTVTGGSVVTVLICVAMATNGLGQAAPFLASISEGCGAAAEIFPVINRKSAIDSFCETGLMPTICRGELEFRNVTLCYPTRPDVPVLSNFNLTVKAGETVALVGASGCGKSSIVSLIPRFYDCSEGAILLDGNNIKDLSLRWLRDRVGLVSQTPTLFPFSIRDNIALGHPDVSDADIVAAATAANAHDFIQAFPEGYDTTTGDKGTQLSGGQRQRIAIARTLVRQPAILLLDEATSALDQRSERAVQRALNRASEGRTTLVIAHRLSTVRRADRIVVLSRNGIVEQGSHRELVTKRGAYYRLLRNHGPNANMEALDEGLSEALVGPAPEPAEPVAEELDSAEMSEDDLETDTENDTELVTTAIPASKMGSEPPTDEGKSEARASMVRSSEAHVEDLLGVNLRTWALGACRPDALYLVAAFVFGGIEACVWPTYAILLSESSGVIRNTNHTPSQVGTWATAYLILAFIMLVAPFMRSYCVSVAGVRLTARKREEVFWSIMHQSMEWHEQPTHSRSALLQLLADDCSKLRNLAGDSLSVSFVVMGTMTLGVGAGIYFCWRVALVVLACLPFVAGGMMLRMKYMFSSNVSSESVYQGANELASHAVHHVRMVYSLNANDRFLNDFTSELDKITAAIDRRMFMVSPVFKPNSVPC